MPRRSFSEFACSLARTLDVIGDAWTPLVIRDVYLGVDTFNDIARDLGISRALLSDRLALLVREGVLREEAYREHPPRARYTLTDQGAQLVPVLIALTQWGDTWRSGGEAPLLFSHDCGETLESQVTCVACGREVTATSLEPHAGPGARDAPGTRVLAERHHTQGEHP